MSSKVSRVESSKPDGEKVANIGRHVSKIPIPISRRYGNSTTIGSRPKILQNLPIGNSRIPILKSRAPSKKHVRFSKTPVSTRAAEAKKNLKLRSSATVGIASNKIPACKSKTPKTSDSGIIRGQVSKIPRPINNGVPQKCQSKKNVTSKSAKICNGVKSKIPIPLKKNRSQTSRINAIENENRVWQPQSHSTPCLIRTRSVKVLASIALQDDLFLHDIESPKLIDASTDEVKDEPKIFISGDKVYFSLNTGSSAKERIRLTSERSTQISAFQCEGENVANISRYVSKIPIPISRRPINSTTIGSRPQILRNLVIGNSRIPILKSRASPNKHAHVKGSKIPVPTRAAEPKKNLKLKSSKTVGIANSKIPTCESKTPKTSDSGIIRSQVSKIPRPINNGLPQKCQSKKNVTSKSAKICNSVKSKIPIPQKKNRSQTSRINSIENDENCVWQPQSHSTPCLIRTRSTKFLAAIALECDLLLDDIESPKQIDASIGELKDGPKIFVSGESAYFSLDTDSSAKERIRLTSGRSTPISAFQCEDSTPNCDETFKFTKFLKCVQRNYQRRQDDILARRLERLLSPNASSSASKTSALLEKLRVAYKKQMEWLGLSYEDNSDYFQSYYLNGNDHLVVEQTRCSDLIKFCSDVLDEIANLTTEEEQQMFRDERMDSLYSKVLRMSKTF